MCSGVLDKIIYKLFLRHIKPEILGYKDSKGNRIKDTRVSNMTHLSNKANIFLGENVFVGHFNYIDGYDQVVIGEGCQLTNQVNILTHSSHHAIRLLGRSYGNVGEDILKAAIKSGPVEIGAYSFIGAHAVVMPGTKMGKGCIVSAFSYVDGDFPDFSIIRGIPGKVVGSTKDIDSSILEANPAFKEYYYLNENHKF